MSLRIEGYALTPSDMQVFAALVQHVDDAGSAAIGRAQLLAELGQPDSDPAWEAVKKSGSRLTVTAVSFSWGEHERLLRMAESMQEVDDVLVVVFSQDLLVAFLGARTTELKQAVHQARGSIRTGMAEAAKNIPELDSGSRSSDYVPD